ncbi:hypothetical protein ACLOJK_022398 [Asimina triloba]
MQKIRNEKIDLATIQRKPFSLYTKVKTIGLEAILIEKARDIKIVDAGLARYPPRSLSPANTYSPDPNTKSRLFYLDVVFALTILTRCLSSTAFSKGADESTKSDVEDSQVRAIAIIDLVRTRQMDSGAYVVLVLLSKTKAGDIAKGGKKK